MLIDPAQVSAPAKKNPSKTVGELSQVLRFVGCYRRYVKNFSREAKILYDLLRIPEDIEDMENRNKSKGHPSSKTTIAWDSKLKDVLESLIKRLMSPPAMAFPDFFQILKEHSFSTQMPQALELGLSFIQNRRENHE